MKASRFVAVLAALVAIVASPGVAQAATITQSFYADSGDACHYGVTDGTLGWVYGSASPLPVTAVDVKGRLTDRPTPSDPSTACPDDHYYSRATFTAYSGSVVVDRETRTADNAVVTFEFTLANSTHTSISEVDILVCRSPVSTLPPAYCGKTVVYLPPPVA
jgi:hypothetical protein